MNYIATSILYLLIVLSAFVSGCRQPDDPASERPIIRRVSFVGIPDKDVTFDAPNGRITVRLPANTNGGLRPIFELTEGAQVVDGLTADNIVDLTPFCRCGLSNQARKVIIRLRNPLTTTVYELYVIAAGQLAARNTQDEFTFSRKTARLDLQLPVENLYGNPIVSRILFTNLETGKVGDVNVGGVCLNSCLGTAPDRLVFSVTTPIENVLTPGRYSISLNGLNFPQRLVVTE